MVCKAFLYLSILCYLSPVFQGIRLQASSEDLDKQSCGTVLVTGGAGFIGSHAAAALLDTGCRVVVIDNLSRGHVENVQVLQDHANKKVVSRKGIRLQASVDNFKFYDVDLGNKDGVSHVFEHEHPRAVIHFAGLAYAGESSEYPLMYYRNNTMNTLQLLEVMERFGCRHIVYSSSSAVYGSPERQPVTEETLPQPLSPYGWSKYMGERLIADWVDRHNILNASHSFSAVLLRYANVIGADAAGKFGERSPRTAPGSHDYLQSVRLSTALFDVADGLLAEFTVAGNNYSSHDGTAVRDYIHVSDLVQAHILALEKLLESEPKEPKDYVATYNVGTGRPYSVLDMVAAAKRVTKVDFTVRFAPGRPGDPPIVTADSNKLQHDLGWRPKYLDLIETLGHQWAFRKRTQNEESKVKVAQTFDARPVSDPRMVLVIDESGLVQGGGTCEAPEIRRGDEKKRG
eukprot:gnl/TRDRNA2_/TRDRNA2_47955_c0_seq1.p1 gnl/TRDRNA2_/TRDRNA2_47955_c0~~gnl/TRDRNA2_/TRDRNA2_47955_c0_seq1.p1  ORF type:complete len:458 (-),score=31.83 gnl/TRDRNA2_/TRDRNA2_47955_c0_seq1:36-1409(-)